MEKIVVDRWIKPNTRIDSSQFAYVPMVGIGTTCMVILVYHRILKFLEKRSGAVSDFSMAFYQPLFQVSMHVCNKFLPPELRHQRGSVVFYPIDVKVCVG